MYYTDKPINTEKDDELGRNGFAKLLAKALISFERTETFTIGIYGKWGIGKTSVVNMALEIISENEKYKAQEERMVVVKFNPWYFSDSEQLFFQFFTRLKNEFQSQKDKSKEKIGRNVISISLVVVGVVVLSKIGLIFYYSIRIIIFSWIPSVIFSAPIIFSEI